MDSGIMGRRGDSKVSPTGTRSSSTTFSASKSDSTYKPFVSGGHSSGNTLNRERGMRSLSRTEWEERRKKGLCYRCGQVYGPAHRCPEGKLRILLLGEDEEESEKGEQLVLEEVSLETGNDNLGGTCLALELAGFFKQQGTLNTFKLEGTIQGIPISMLVDSGATHNFISSKLVAALDIPSNLFAGIHIRLGDGHVVFIERQCEKVAVQMGTCSFLVDVLVFDTGDLDLILGMDWLQSLGEVTHDWKNAWMKFVHLDVPVVLYGTNTKQLSATALQQWLPGDDEVQTAPAGELKKAQSTLPVVMREGLSSGQVMHLQNLLQQFEVLFCAPTGLPPSRKHDHRIPLLNEQPVAVRPYRYPHIQKNEIEKQVQELLNLGMIRTSHSAYSSPVILVRKKDNSWRMCVDYRALNKVTIPDKFPIPVVEELLDELYGATYFSKLDLKSGYNQIRMHQDSIEKTAFRTHEGHYEYLVMPFGLMNAPATFQAIMNDIFKHLLRSTVVIFFDDILVYSSSWEKHLADLSVVFQVLATNSFSLNPQKCSFGQTTVEYLGHLINGQGVSMDPTKVQAVEDWPVPTNIKGLRGFLGLTGYYRKFIQHYGSIARPLTDLTKKNSFLWSDQAQEAFQQLKHALITAPVLTLPNFEQPFVIECDASGRGIGAVLMQNHKPIAYFSKGLSDRNLSKSAYEREMMALVLAVQHWRQYLLGTRFLVYTDQKSLKFLLQQRVTTPDQQNWVAKLLGYDFEIHYKSGRMNRAADALSRQAEYGQVNTLCSGPVWVQGAQLIEEAQGDPHIQEVMQGCLTDPSKHPGYTVKKGVLFFKDRLVIPSSSQHIPALLQEFHMTATGGHSGYYRTYRRIAANLFWPGMTATVKQFVKECEVCQRCKTSTLMPSGLLQPLAIPEAVWEDLSMDFIGGLPMSKGFNVILVVVDRLSKYAHFVALKHPYTAKGVADLFVKEVIRHHGIPKSIVSDRDPLFISNFWQEIFRLQGTKLHMSSAYHPETDGQTEVVNRCLEAYLRCFVVDQPKAWAQWLPWAEFWYNSTFHSSTGVTPFEMVYGRRPPTVFQYSQGEIRVEAVARDLKERDMILKTLKQHLANAQSAMKVKADKHRRELKFMVGEWVYVKLQPYRQMTVAVRKNHKLSPRFFGPFQVMEKVGPVAYKLLLPVSSKVHPVFHVSLLKKAIQGQAEPYFPQELELAAEDVASPVQVLNNRHVQVGSRMVEQLLVQWQNQTTEEATWEEKDWLTNQFPNLSLEVKTLKEGAGNDTNDEGWEKAQKPPILHVYSRRGKVGNTH
ncbi:hypothetical protein E3N88_39174 [Mikania micrantha]|uniref:Reverse transcriptase n=1 Tax=Mikania micrantha TaxID=192012 RepID=A0A5N6LW88_9ASTR|nr:hypothetical protein E3N88_39174 [Mikania micrantha]